MRAGLAACAVLVVTSTAACTGDQTMMTAPTPSASIAASASQRAIATPSPTERADWQRCSTDGYSISYPEGWFTASLGPKTQCRWFDREEFELERGTEPPVTDLIVQERDVRYATASRQLEDGPTHRSVDTEQVTLGDKRAVRFEREHSGGLYPDGTLSYGYLIEGPSVVVYVQTVALPNADEREYEDNQQVVDRAAASVTFGDRS